MKLIILKTVDPYINLAIEEYLFLHAEEEIFMLWQNKPSVIIGCNQNAFAEVNLSYAEEHGIHVARRITGGGAVYHDLGNINYSYITPTPQSDTLDFARFCEPILRSLQALGVNASLSGRNDIEIDGKKISGNAQHRKDGRLLHHGTLLFDTDRTVLEAVLKPRQKKLETRAIRSVGARVTNLSHHLPTPMTKEALICHIAAYIKHTYAAKETPSPMCKEIEALTARNASKEWLYPEKDLLSRYTETKEERYPFGTVELLLKMQNDRIAELSLRGDFFSLRPVTELESLLGDVRISEVKACLETVDIGQYVCGMDNSEFLSLLQS